MDEPLPCVYKANISVYAEAFYDMPLRVYIIIEENPEQAF